MYFSNQDQKQGIVIYLDSANVFNTIYTDSLIGIEFAYCAYLIYTPKFTPQTKI